MYEWILYGLAAIVLILCGWGIIRELSKNGLAKKNNHKQEITKESSQEKPQALPKTHEQQPQALPKTHEQQPQALPKTHEQQPQALPKTQVNSKLEAKTILAETKSNENKTRLEIKTSQIELQNEKRSEIQSIPKENLGNKVKKETIQLEKVRHELQKVRLEEILAIKKELETIKKDSKKIKNVKNISKRKRKK